MGIDIRTFREKAGKARLLCAGLAFSLVLIGAFAVLHFITEARRIAPEDILTFRGLPADATADIFFKDSRGTHQLDLVDGIVKLPEGLRENFSLPYRLSATIRGFSGRKDIDLVWSLDRDGRVYDVVLSGFSPEERLDFNLNDIRAHKNIPFDWSGRFKAHFILLTGVDTNACVDVRGTGAAFGFCHMITGKKS